MTDRNSLRPLPSSSSPSPRGPLAVWAALDPAVKLVLQLVALVGAIATAVQLYNQVVTEGELAVVRAADAKSEDVQSAAIEDVEDEVDLLFQTNVKLATDNDWIKQELVGVRQDLRRMDRGLPLPALPAPVHTSAIPTPTRSP